MRNTRTVRRKALEDALLKLVGVARAEEFIKLLDDTEREIKDDGLITRSTDSHRAMLAEVRSLERSLGRGAAEPEPEPDLVYNVRSMPRLSPAPTWITVQNRTAEALGNVTMAQIAGQTLRSVPARPVGSRRRTARPVTRSLPARSKTLGPVGRTARATE